MRAPHGAPSISPDAGELVGPPALEAPAPVASVAMPTTAASELGGLLPAGTEVNGLSIVLALLAVLGGGAAWRFYRQRSREQHDLKMRELELRAADGQGHASECKATTALRTEVQRLEVRLAELEKRQSTFGLSAEAGDLEERIKKLERAARPAAATTRGKAVPAKGKRKT